MPFMRYAVSTFVLLFAFARAANCSPVKPVPTSGVKLNVSASSKAWWMGARHVPLAVVVTNSGAAAIKFPNPATSVAPDSVVNLTLTDSSGQHPERLVSGVLRPEADPWNDVHLASGESYSIDLDKAGIANEYETVPSGHYRVSVQLTYTDSRGHDHSASASVADVDVRDVRDFVVSSIAVVTPAPETRHKLVDPDSSAHAAIVATPGGAYWLAYWTERNPIVTDTQPAVGGNAPSQAAPPFMRKWVSTLYWLGRVNKSTLFELSRKSGNDLLVRFTDINGTARAAEVDHFWASPKFVTAPAGPPLGTATTIQL